MIFLRKNMNIYKSSYFVRRSGGVCRCLITFSHLFLNISVVGKHLQVAEPLLLLLGHVASHHLTLALDLELEFYRCFLIFFGLPNLFLGLRVLARRQIRTTAVKADFKLQLTLFRLLRSCFWLFNLSCLFCILWLHNFLRRNFF